MSKCNVILLVSLVPDNGLHGLTGVKIGVDGAGGASHRDCDRVITILDRCYHAEVLPKIGLPQQWN